MLEYGYRSKCCKAPIRMGSKKIKKTNQKIKVWVCVACGTRDIDLIPTAEARTETKPQEWWDDETDDDYSE